MYGMKNETDCLQCFKSLTPSRSRINFACPTEKTIRDLNPFGDDLPLTFSTGFLDEMVRANDDGIVGIILSSQVLFSTYTPVNRT